MGGGTRPGLAWLAHCTSYLDTCEWNAALAANDEAATTAALKVSGRTAPFFFFTHVFGSVSLSLSLFSPFITTPLLPYLAGPFAD